MCPIVKIYNGFAARGCSAVTAVEYGKIIWCNLNSVLELWIVIEVTNAEILFINIPCSHLNLNVKKIFYSALDEYLILFLSWAQVGVLYSRATLFPRLSPFYTGRQLKAIFIKPLLDAWGHNNIPRMVRQ